MAEFKDVLIYLRKRSNMSQSELAKKIGVSASTIGNYEQGTRTPNFEIEEALADTFNVSLDVLRGKVDANPHLLKYHNILVADKSEEQAEETIAKAVELYERYESLTPEKKAEFDHFLEFLQSKP